MANSSPILRVQQRKRAAPLGLLLPIPAKSGAEVESARLRWCALVVWHSGALRPEGREAEVVLKRTDSAD